MKCDIEEIKSKRSYAGPTGYFSGGFRAARKKLDEIEPIQKDPAKYDLLILAYPLSAGKMPPAVRAYTVQNKTKLKNVAVVSVSGSGDEKALDGFEEATGKAKAGF